MERSLSLPRVRHAPAFAALVALVSGLALAALALGPVQLTPGGVLAGLFGSGTPVEHAIIWQIRLPRLMLGIAVGLALALSGAALQGVLRNPLADPGLIGVSAGASLGAVGVIVLGDALLGEIPGTMRAWLLPLAAFVGATLVIGFVFRLAQRDGTTSVATLILAGVAVNAIAGAGIGTMTY
ncbi:MAG: iron chelate uptake ABC transporter family permease subunit, partial [Pseudomonadota bacterium]